MSRCAGNGNHIAMSPGMAPGEIRVQVPRHNTPPVSRKLAVGIKELAKAQNLRVDTVLPDSILSSVGLSQAIVRCFSSECIVPNSKPQESASDWNSLLTSARAERGPQWDVGTQK